MSSSSPILFLNETNFTVNSEKSLTVNIPNFSLVLFYSTRCPHCKQMIEVIKRMPTLINGCTFAMVNLDESRGVVQKAKLSTLELKFVPFLVFYASGIPYMVYNGPTVDTEIKRFVVQVSEQYVNEFQANNNNKTYLNSSGTNSQQTTKGRANVVKSDLGCSLDDRACIEHSLKRYSGCYVSMKDAYVSNINA
jgi:thioredoxin-like negative regulator of GroEL